MDKLKRVWNLFSTLDSIWSLVGYILIPVGGVGGVWVMLTSIPVSNWVIPIGFMLSCWLVAAIFILSSRAIKRQRERDLTAILQILHRSIAAEREKVGAQDQRVSESLSQVIGILRDLIETKASTLYVDTKLAQKADKPIDLSKTPFTDYLFPPPQDSPLDSDEKDA